MNSIFQFVMALAVGAILGGVGHLWLKTERLDREQARHAAKFDAVAETLADVKKTLESLNEGVGSVGNSVARIEGSLANGFAKGAKAPIRRK
jgi:hypothetical protein